MNMFVKSKLIVLAGGAVALSGCAVNPENAYPEATNARECQVLYEADVRQREQSVRSTPSSGNWLADAIGGGVGAGIIEGQTNALLAYCLERVGASPAEIQSLPSISTPTTPAPAVTPVPTAGPLCLPGAGIMVRGDMYCVGNI